MQGCVVRQDGTPLLLDTGQSSRVLCHDSQGSKNSTLCLVWQVLFSRSYFVLPRPNPCFFFP